MSITHPLIISLFQQNRTILGDGFDKSLQIIDAYIGDSADVSVHKIPTGTSCGTWTILPEWKVSKAILRDANGTLLCDYQTDPHCLWHYSVPFTGTLLRDELEPHLVLGPQPNMVPSIVAYYSNRWGFSMCPKRWAENHSETFTVEIETSLHDGALSLGEVFIQGQIEDTILIDAVLSFPALANNLSGAGLAADLIGFIKNQNPFYSYRILFTPETIGPIAAHYHLPHLLEKVVGGFTMLNLGTSDGFHYKRSRQGNSPVDKAFDYLAKQQGSVCDITNYNVITGETGNEKAYNSLGIEVPIGRFCAAKAGSYPEYDTSADNLALLSDQKLQDSVDMLQKIYAAIEATVPFGHLFEGEPFLSGFNIFEQIKTEADRQAFDSLMAFSDGHHSLIDIAEKIDLTIDALQPAAKIMRDKHLIYYAGAIRTFRSDRLVYKELIADDASPDYVNWLADEEVNRYLESRDTNLTEVRDYITTQKSDPNSFFVGIYDAISLAHIGNVKLEPINWKEKTAIFGIMIGDKSYWNKGIGHEVTTAIANYAFRNLNLSVIELGVLEDNIGAIRAYQKSGFQVISQHMRARNGFDQEFSELTMQLTPQRLQQVLANKE